MKKILKLKRTVRLFYWELKSMDEYSCSLPTATTLWKAWKCNVNAFKITTSDSNTYKEPKWIIGQYVPDKDKNYVKIIWFDIILLEGPKPKHWEKPDWSNYKRWLAEQKHGPLSPSWELNGCPTPK